MTRAFRSPALLLAVFALMATGLRALLAIKLELAPDEAYYWLWSRQLAFSYPDHPPLIAWLIRAGTALGGQSALGVRLSGLVISFVAVGLVYSIGRRAGFSASRAALAAALGSLLPLSSAGALIATPDAALGCAYLLGVHAMLGLLERPALATWLELGAAIGLSLLAKLSGVLLVLLVPVMLIAARHARVPLRLGLGAFVAVGLGLGLALVYFSVDLSKGRSAVLFQLLHLRGALPGSGSVSLLAFPLRLVELLAGQLGLLTPLLACFAIYGLRCAAATPPRVVVAAAVLLPLAATVLAAAFVHPEQSWPALGHPLVPLLCWLGIERLRSERCRRGWTIATAALAVAATVVIHVHAVRPFLPLPPARDPVSRLHGWHALVRLAQAARTVDAVVCDNYGLAAELAWRLRVERGIAPISSGDRPFFSRPAPGRVYLLLDEREDFGAAALNVSCRVIEVPETLALTRADGAVVRQINVARGTACRVP